MSRDSKKVEQAAARWAAQEIDKADRLSSYIDTNDRTLSTDGHVEVFATPHHTVGGLIGRVAVQVKGTRPPSEKSNFHKWQVSRDELNALQSLAPVVYIVAYVRDDYSVQCGSYSVFTSFRVTHILTQMNARQKTKNVQLYPWPDNAQDIENIFTYAFKRGNQISGMSLETLTNVESLGLSSSRDVDLSRPFAVRRVEGSAQVVARLAGGQVVDLDIDAEIVPAEYFQTRVQQTLRSANVTFESYSIQRISPTVVVIEVNDGVRLELVNDPVHKSSALNLAFDSPRYLASRIRAIQFYVDVLRDGRVWIGAQEIEVSGVPRSDLEEDEEYLRSLTAFRDDVEVLGGNPEWIDVESVTGDERGLLARWSEFARGQVHPQPEPEESGRVRLAIGSSYIELLYLRGAGGASGRVIDYFDASCGYVFALSDPDQKPASSPIGATPFDILQQDHVLKNLVNIKFKDVLHFYGRLEDSEITESMMSNSILRFWRFGYENLPNASDFLRAGRVLAESLISRFPESRSIAVRKVNYWALSDEVGTIDSSDIERIRVDRRSASRSSMESVLLVELVYAVILHDWSEVDSLLDEILSGGLEVDPQWPVWTFLERRLDGDRFAKLNDAIGGPLEIVGAALG